MTLEHKYIPKEGVHVIHRWKVADETELNTLSVLSEDIDKLALVTDNGNYYRLESYSPVEWVAVRDLSGYYTTEEVDNLLSVKVDDSDVRLSDARDWVAPTVTKVDAEERISPDNKKWSPLRVGEAIDAWWVDKNLETKINGLPTNSELTGVLDTKVDKVIGKSLSDENYTLQEKNKLASLESSKFKGLYASLIDLQNTYPTSEAGAYAFVDGGIGNPNELYVWDTGSWEKVGGDITTATPAQVKDLLLQNADTNNFGDAELAIVQGAASQADLTSGLSGKADSAHTHIIGDVSGLQDELNGKVDVVSGKGLSSEDYTASEKTKLAGVEEGATSNSDDSTLLSRSNHTGTQLLSTISDAGTAASADVTTSREDTTSGRLLKVGDFGLGGVLRLTDVDVVFKSGLYRVDDNTVGIPESSWGSLLVCGDSSMGGVITQIYVRSSNGALWTRGRQNNTWSPWRKYLKVGDYGLGEITTVNSDYDVTLPVGFYLYAHTANSRPPLGGSRVTLNLVDALGAGMQIACRTVNNNIDIRSVTPSAKAPWVSLLHSGDKAINSTPDTDDEKYMTKKQVIDLLTEKGLLP